MLKNLFKDYTKVNILFHVSIVDIGIESALRTLESSDRIKNTLIDGKPAGQNGSSTSVG